MHSKYNDSENINVKSSVGRRKANPYCEQGVHILLDSWRRCLLVFMKLSKEQIANSCAQSSLSL